MHSSSKIRTTIRDVTVLIKNTGQRSVRHQDIHIRRDKGPFLAIEDEFVKIAARYADSHPDQETDA